MPLVLKDLGTSGSLKSAQVAFPASLKAAPGFRNYIASLLAGTPSHPPEAALHEWQDFLKELRSHWIAPLLYWQISWMSKKFYPPLDVIEELRDAFLAASGRSMQVAKQLAKITVAFQEQGVELLVLKGPALASWLYPHPAARPHSDIDLLVRPWQLARGREILKGLSYRCVWDKFDQSSMARLYKHEEFIPGPGMANCKQVELHWNFDPDLGMLDAAEMDGVFTRAVEVNAQGLTFKTLSPVDFFIANAIHMGIHSTDPVMRLIWIYDIYLLARKLRTPDDWAALQIRSVAWRGHMVVERALKSAVEWTGLVIPPPFDDFSCWPRPDDAEYQRPSPNCHFKALAGWVEDSHPGNLQKMTAFARLVFPPPSHVRSNYPPAREWLLPLSYARRWLYWAGKLHGSGWKPS